MKPKSLSLGKYALKIGLIGTLSIQCLYPAHLMAQSYSQDSTKSLTNKTGRQILESTMTAPSMVRHITNNHLANNQSNSLAYSTSMRLQALRFEQMRASGVPLTRAAIATVRQEANEMNLKIQSITDPKNGVVDQEKLKQIKIDAARQTIDMLANRTPKKKDLVKAAKGGVGGVAVLLAKNYAVDVFDFTVKAQSYYEESVGKTKSYYSSTMPQLMYNSGNSKHKELVAVLAPKHQDILSSPGAAAEYLFNLGAENTKLWELGAFNDSLNVVGITGNFSKQGLLNHPAMEAQAQQLDQMLKLGQTAEEIYGSMLKSVKKQTNEAIDLAKKILTKIEYLENLEREARSQKEREKIKADIEALKDAIRKDESRKLQAKARILNSAGESLIIIGQLTNAPDLQKLGQVSKIASEFAKITDQFKDLHEPNGLESFSLSVDYIQLGLQVVSLLAQSGQKSTEQVMLEEIQAIKKMIAEMHEEMRERLSLMSEQMAFNHFETMGLLHEIKQVTLGIAQTVESTRDEVQNRVDEEYSKTYRFFEKNCINDPSRNEIALGFPNCLKAAEQLTVGYPFYYGWRDTAFQTSETWVKTNGSLNGIHKHFNSLQSLGDQHKVDRETYYLDRILLNGDITDLPDPVIWHSNLELLIRFFEKHSAYINREETQKFGNAHLKIANRVANFFTAPGLSQKKKNIDYPLLARLVENQFQNLTGLAAGKYHQYQMAHQNVDIFGDFNKPEKLQQWIIPFSTKYNPNPKSEIDICEENKSNFSRLSPNIFNLTQNFLGPKFQGNDRSFLENFRMPFTPFTFAQNWFYSAIVEPSPRFRKSASKTLALGNSFFKLCIDEIRINDGELVESLIIDNIAQATWRPWLAGHVDYKITHFYNPPTQSQKLVTNVSMKRQNFRVSGTRDKGKGYQFDNIWPRILQSMTENLVVATKSPLNKITERGFVMPDSGTIIPESWYKEIDRLYEETHQSLLQKFAKENLEQIANYKKDMSVMVFLSEFSLSKFKDKDRNLLEGILFNKETGLPSLEEMDDLIWKDRLSQDQLTELLRTRRQKTLDKLRDIESYEVESDMPLELKQAFVRIRGFFRL